MEGYLSLPQAWELYHQFRWKGASLLDQSLPFSLEDDERPRAEIRKEEIEADAWRLSTEKELAKPFLEYRLTAIVKGPLGEHLNVTVTQWKDAQYREVRPFRGGPFDTFDGRHAYVEKKAFMLWLFKSFPPDSNLSPMEISVLRCYQYAFADRPDDGLRRVDRNEQLQKAANELELKLSFPSTEAALTKQIERLRKKGQI